MAAQLVAVLQLDGRQSQGYVFEACSVCDRIDFNYFDEGMLANEDALKEAIGTLTSSLKTIISMVLLNGCHVYIGVTMRPRWRFHGIRDPWPEAMQSRTSDTAEAHISR